MAETKVTINGETDAGSSYLTWTPTLTNFTGTVNVARYKLIGKTCHFYIEVTQGASVTGRHTFSLPVAASASIQTAIGWGAPVARGVILDAGIAAYDAFGGLTSTTTCGLGYLLVSGTNVAQGQTSGTVPMTWAIGVDKFWLYGSYEIA